MKLVVAIIEPEMLPIVKRKLFDSYIDNITVTNALAEGEDYSKTFRGVSHDVTLHKKVRLEIVVNEDLLEPAITAILTVARDNDSKAGKIYVHEVTDFIQIPSGKRGPSAI